MSIRARESDLATQQSPRGDRVVVGGVRRAALRCHEISTWRPDCNGLPLTRTFRLPDLHVEIEAGQPV